MNDISIAPYTGVKYNEINGLWDVYVDDQKVTALSTEERAKESLDFYVNVYYNPSYNERFGLKLY